MAFVIFALDIDLKGKVFEKIKMQAFELLNALNI